MPRRKRRQLTPEQKSDAVRLVRKVGNLSKVARDLDLTESAQRSWVKQADIDLGHGPEGALTSEEREEPQWLRRENRTLEMKRDFLREGALQPASSWAGYARLPHWGRENPSPHPIPSTLCTLTHQLHPGVRRTPEDQNTLNTRRLLKTVGFTCLSILVAFVLTELMLRVLLFSPVADGWSLARAFRDPNRFSDWRDRDRWWVLQYLWSSYGRRRGRPPWAPHYDDRLGWTSERFLPNDYLHIAEADLRMRRPILLLGDSFSACVTADGVCYETLLDESSLGSECALLNYGVCGYALDQTYLLLQSVLERFASRRPIVVVGLLVDDDLDRCLLEFRDWPKPRLRVENGRLVVPEERVPTAEKYLAGDPALPASYLLSMLRVSLSNRGSKNSAEVEARKQELSRLILRAIVTELRDREVPFSFLLFNDADHSLDPGTNGWRQPLVREELNALGAPYVEVRDELMLLARSERAELGSYFRYDKHLNERGNVAAFATILRGLAICGAGVTVPRATWAFEATLDAEGGGVARYQRGVNRFFRDAGGRERLILRAGREPTTVRYMLFGATQTFRATAWSVGPAAENSGMQVCVLVDGRVRWCGTLRPREKPQPIDIDLRGAERLELVVTPDLESTHHACAVFSDPSLD